MGNLLIFQTHCSSLGPSSEPLAQCTFRQPEVWRSHQQRAARYQVLTQLADTDTTGTCLEICSLCDVPVPKWVLCIFWQFWIFLFKENTTLATVISPFWDFTVVPPSLPSVVSEISFVSFESMLLFQYHIWEPTFLHFFLFQMGFCRFCFWKLTWDATLGAVHSRATSFVFENRLGWCHLSEVGNIILWLKSVQICWTAKVMQGDQSGNGGCVADRARVPKC